MVCTRCGLPWGHAANASPTAVTRPESYPCCHPDIFVEGKYAALCFITTTRHCTAAQYHAKLHYTVSCHIISLHIVLLQRITLCDTALYHAELLQTALQCHTVLYHDASPYALLYHTIPYHKVHTALSCCILLTSDYIMLYDIIPCPAALYHAALCCHTVSYCAIPDSIMI